MNEEFDKYDELENDAFAFAGADEFDDDVSDYDDWQDFDDALSDIDFSEIRGKNFKKSLSRVSQKIQKKRGVKKVIVPDNRKVIVEGNTRIAKKAASKERLRREVRSEKPTILPRDKKLTNQIPVERSGKYQLKGKKEKKISKVIIPDSKKVIVEGVSKFILSQDAKDVSIKQIGYYKGKKLKQLVLTFNNNSAIPFVLELFNPSMPLDYLYSTSLNLNDKIQVAGGYVSYSDVLYNQLANPMLIPNAKFIFSGPNLAQQRAVPLIVKNKSAEGKVKIHPLNLDLQIDNMQVANNIVFFDLFDMLNRAYIPDGMDVIEYKVYPGMTVTMGFFYEQVSLKKVFFKEARNSKDLM